MAGGERGELQVGEFERHAILHLFHAMIRAESMLIQTGSAWRGEREFMPRDMVDMGVRDEAARLAATDVDGKLSGGQEQAGVVMKHGGELDKEARSGGRPLEFLRIPLQPEV